MALQVFTFCGCCFRWDDVCSFHFNADMFRENETEGRPVPHCYATIVVLTYGMCQAFDPEDFLATDPHTLDRPGP